MGSIIPTLTETLFSIHDFSEELKKYGAQPIKLADAKGANDLGFGIFHAVQSFKQNVRRKEHLAAIRFWAIDIDEGTKEEQIERINRGLRPTITIETKNGFHCYWRADDATLSSWEEIVTDRLVPFYRADRNARDVCRILRTPGFYHQKIEGERFMIVVSDESDRSYSESVMKFYYPDVNKHAKESLTNKITSEVGEVSDSLWEFIYRLDCVDALTKISGRPEVRGEHFSFKRNSTGTQNILVDGSSTSTWVDVHGRIGSGSGGGPTIYNWITWYKTSGRDAVKLIREVYPECPRH